MSEKRIQQELEEMGKRFSKPKAKDEFYQMCERETQKQKKKVV